MCLGATGLDADDTDIYYSAFVGDVLPMVMIALDLRSNLSNTQCSDVHSDTCRIRLGDDLYLNLDLMTHKDPDDLTDIDFGPDGVPDAAHYVSDTAAAASSEVSALRAAWASAENLTGSYMDGKARLFDLLRAAFQYILNSKKVQDSGLWVGLMISHENSNDCAGPAAVPNGSNDGCSNGAYILKGFFDIADDIELADFYQRLAALPTPGYTPLANAGRWNGHVYQLNEVYFEFYRYITGQDMYNGWLGYQDYHTTDEGESLTDFPDNDAPYNNAMDIHLAPDPGTYSGSGSSANYVSPFETLTPDDWSCSSLYMINTVLGAVQNDSGSNDVIDDPLPVGLDLHFGNNTEDSEREDMIRKLFQMDLAGHLDPNDTSTTLIGVDVKGEQNLTSFILSDSTNNKQDGWAAASDTEPALELGDGEEIKYNIEAVFDSIISESSNLISTSVPVNVFNRAEAVDNVFLALFQAESGSRWPGNLKKLKLGRRIQNRVDDNNNVIGTQGVLDIFDAQGTPQIAFDPVDGRLKRSALTYWTDPLGADVTPAGCVDGAAPLAEDENCGKDGRSVTRGGAGQMIFGYNSNDSACFGTAPGTVNTVGACSRELYTEDPGNPLALIGFDGDSNTAALLADFLDPNNPNAAEAQTLIKWARGAVELSATLTELPAAAQRWMLGDILHSKPLPLNYGDTDGDDDATSGYGTDNPDIRLLFGSNDGWFRMIRNTDSAGAESGDEVWGFMPLEVMAVQKDLAKDVLPATGHPYAVDGDVTALLVDRDSDGNIEDGENDGNLDSTGDKAFVYFGLRRGGKAYYALDVSNPNGTPKLMWKITNSGDFSELGLTFSAPRTAVVNYDGTPKPAVIFAGGYNGGWTADGLARVGKDIVGNRADDPVGNAIYVVDAVTGVLIWKTVGTATSFAYEYVQSNMDHSIPSDISLLDSDQNGVIDMGFVGDTGGDVWRIDLPESTGSDVRASWKTTQLGSFGYDGSDIATDRRFFHAPDILLARDEVYGSVNRDFIGVIIGSGNRASPKGMDVDDFIYYIKDPLLDSGAGVDRSATVFHGDGSAGLEDITEICQSTAACNARDLSLGWQLALQAGGEKSLAVPLIAQGTIFFATYLPDTAGADTCDTGLGGGRLYAINVDDGEPARAIYGDADELGKSQRYTELAARGIPSESTPVVQGDDYLMLESDGDVKEIDGHFKWKIYWAERDVDDL